MRLLGLLAIAILLSACATTRADDGPVEPDARCTPLLASQTNCKPWMFNTDPLVYTTY